MLLYPTPRSHRLQYKTNPNSLNGNLFLQIEYASAKICTESTISLCICVVTVYASSKIYVAVLCNAYEVQQERVTTSITPS